MFIIAYNVGDETNAFGPNVGAKQYNHVVSHAAYKLAEFSQIVSAFLFFKWAFFLQAVGMALSVSEICFSFRVALAGRFHRQWRGC